MEDQQIQMSAINNGDDSSQHEDMPLSNNSENDDSSLSSEINEAHPQSNLETHALSDNADGLSVHHHIHLGLLQTILTKFSRNVQKAVMITIVIGIAICTSDTSSDLGLCIFYISQGLAGLAAAVILCDYFPGLIVFAHDYTSEDWEESSIKEKVWTIFALTLQPFSLFITNLTWSLDVGCKRKHKLARLSTILHGCTEAPLQFIMQLCAFSWAILPLPWTTSTNIVDSNGNKLHLGQITIAAFALSCLGIIKGSGESFEARTTEEQMLSMNWALVNMIFRLISTTFIVIILNIFCIPLFVVQLFANYLVLLKNDKLREKWASTVSSIAVSLFIPTWISKNPHNFQLRHKKSEEEEKAEEAKQKEEYRARKLVSYKLAMTVNPLIMGFNTTAFLILKYTDFIQSTVWTDSQLEDCFLYLLTPLFFLSLIVSFSFSHHLEVPADDNQSSSYLPSKHWKNIKRALSLICLLGVIGSSITFGIVVDQLNRSTYIAINHRNELIAIPIINKGGFKDCTTSAAVRKCTNLTFSELNFRTAALIDNVAYLDASPTQLKEKIDNSILRLWKTDFYSISDIVIWKEDAPSTLREKSPYCKKCLFPSRICDQMLNAIQEIDFCNGM